ncbi:SDR family oxidoreductase [Aspergillus clavatus NRRL 1]|uniref:2,4-dienoyl-CoA reductase [(3E)-enoyl-CoA-producing] n=1 Tax=Aspergillus clavatus (strain ATCC 1007 / CBS 513.65 / DSM 816 / NCTC 3887 / NRRL 1 / QM 1276 / 107) TaxID=344612 RepID=A1CA79_ASPCL|nr:oxidoreductase, short-chain dehydrogenase/reductase family [Aspergillus clavatus NRRL 1]EAW12647.1 oxidoreductase, short-chain dehydrogenase/reductase family [Aspergillus clavatus NRRL 1]
MPVPREDYISDSWKEGIFTNKVVFCTGGAGNICSAQVRALVHLGADACIVGRNVEKTETVAKDIATARPGAKVIGIGAVDVRKYDDLKDAVDRCVKELGAIDYVIAGAAGNFLASIQQLSVNAFKSVIDIDVLGSYNTLKATLPYLIESAKKHRVDSETLRPSPLGTGGRIIFVSATIHYRAIPFQAHVAVAKAGIDALSHTVSIEYGPLGVTSNIIAPGPISSTEGLDRLLPSDAMQSYIKSQPLGRFGSVRDIADATVYLFSNTGSYVSGQILVVDGASWRMSAGGAAQGQLQYPDFLLSGETVQKVKGQKKSKL